MNFTSFNGGGKEERQNKESTKNPRNSRPHWNQIGKLPINVYCEWWGHPKRKIEMMNNRNRACDFAWRGNGLRIVKSGR